MSLPLQAQLLRGFAVDFLTAHDNAVVERIMDPAYRLAIGGHLLSGRDEAYLPATAAQLDLFPGLVVTAHDVVLGEDAVALRFTEHGVSARERKAASWGGITLFRIERGRIAQGWAEEDYLARKRQLKTGRFDPVLPPHPAPWDEPVRPPDPATEALVTGWLQALRFDEVEEIASQGPRLAELIAPDTVAISTMFSAGPRAAFHAVLSGAYRGGFEEVRADGAPITLSIAGIVDTDGGHVVRAQLCADRLGLQRGLAPR